MNPSRARALTLLPILVLALGACGSDTGADTGSATAADTTADTTADTAPPSATQPVSPGASPTADAPTADPPAPDPASASEPGEPVTTRLIPYTGGESVGATVQSRGDAKRLTGSPAAFQQFIGTVAEQLVATSPCADQGYVGVTVELVRTDGFASGALNDCGSVAVLWAVVDGSWRQITDTQDTWDCPVLKEYEVPSDIAGNSCFDYNGDHRAHSYHQA